MKLRPITSAVLFALTVAAATYAHADDVRRSYIVQLADKPVATYDGSVSGLQATKPPSGQRLNVDASSVQNYITYLETKQADVLATVNQAQFAIDNLALAEVPEPGSLALIGLGMGALLARRRKSAPSSNNA